MNEMKRAPRVLARLRTVAMSMVTVAACAAAMLLPTHSAGAAPLDDHGALCVVCWD